MTQQEVNELNQLLDNYNDIIKPECASSLDFVFVDGCNYSDYSDSGSD